MQVHWHVSFSDGETQSALQSITQDVSSDGFYCVAKVAFVPGEIRTCMLELPAHPVRIYCKVRIIRVEALAERETYGIGCRIEDYRFRTGELAVGSRANHLDGMAVFK